MTPNAALALALLFGPAPATPKADPPALTAPAAPKAAACPCDGCDCAPCECGPKAGPAKGYVSPAAATVTVYVPTGGGAGFAGTGTVVWAEAGKSYVVTNYHVIEANAGRFTVTVNSTQKSYPARPLGRSGEGDAVVLEIDAELPAAVLGDDSPAGTPVTHHGNTTGPQRGRVVGYQWVAAPGWRGTQMYTDYRSASGDSGAGVFNDRGELVGVHWGGPSPDVAGDGKRRVVPVGVVRRLLAAACPRCPNLAARLGVKAEAPKADTRTWQVNGQGNYTSDEIRRMGFRVPGDPAPPATCPGGVCRPQAPAFTAPGICPNGRCPLQR